MIVGIIIGFLMALFLFISFYLGYRYGSTNTSNKPQEKLTREQKEELKRRNEAFQKIMNYDINQAYGRDG